MKADNLYPFLDTPSLVVDLDKMESNIAEMAALTQSAGVNLRPHTKTHKSVEIARQQIAAGAHGITVAKVGEAEVMAYAGIKDIRIAYPICGDIKLARLRHLLEFADISVSLDSLEVASGLSKLGQAIGRPLPVLLDINVGMNRCGVLPGEEALSTARQISALPGVTLVGVLTHEGNVQFQERTQEGLRQGAVRAAEAMSETARLLRTNGIGIQEVSIGSTPAVRYNMAVPGITEVRPGTYVFNDFNCVVEGVATVETCALTVLVTVVSIAADDRAIVDAGSKVFSSDGLAHSERRGFGYVLEHPDIVIDHFNEEHGYLILENAKSRLRIGQRLQVIPNHVCPVVNLADYMYGVRSGVLEKRIEVSGRGKAQ